MTAADISDSLALPDRITMADARAALASAITMGADPYDDMSTADDYVAAIAGGAIVGLSDMMGGGVTLRYDPPGDAYGLVLFGAAVHDPGPTRRARYITVA